MVTPLHGWELEKCLNFKYKEFVDFYEKHGYVDLGMTYNIFSTEDETFKVLEKGDFKLPKGLRGTYTNAKLDKPFDQMAFLSPDVEKQVALAKAGVFPFYNYVYRDSDQEVYTKGEEKKKYSDLRTYKMSDHLPIWVELGIDFSRDYLNNKMKSR